ncbi:hypothetical protein V2V90_06745 [Agrobacterium leguminum]
MNSSDLRKRLEKSSHAPSPAQHGASENVLARQIMSIFISL